ncbi:MAG: metallophosphoesterase family protein [Shimia sp.]
MRILHAADLHLDSPLRSIVLRDPDLGARLHLASRAVLSRIVDTAIDRRVDALVLAGDVFDGAEPDLAARAHLTAELARLARAGIPTVLIRGNHDALLDLDRHGPVGADVHLLDRDRPTVTLRGADFHGLGFDAPHSHESALPRYPAPTPGRPNVGLMHTSLDGAPGHDPYAPCRLGDLLAHGYGYWALGHLHGRAVHRGEAAVAVMPGIPQGRHAREPGVGSVTLATLGDADRIEVEEIPVARLAFAPLAVDLAGAHDGAARVDAVVEALEGARRGTRDVALRITLGGDGAAAWADDPAGHLAPILDAYPDLHLEAVRLDLPPVATDNPLSDDLALLMREEAAKPALRAAAREEIVRLRAALPPDIRGILDAALPADDAADDPLADAALDALWADGMAAIMAQTRRP